jgi:hypothetical protein
MHRWIRAVGLIALSISDLNGRYVIGAEKNPFIGRWQWDGSRLRSTRKHEAKRAFSLRFIRSYFAAWIAGSTMIFPVICGCSEQKYSYVPGSLKVKE